MDEEQLDWSANQQSQQQDQQQDENRFQEMQQDVNAAVSMPKTSRSATTPSSSKNHHQTKMGTATFGNAAVNLDPSSSSSSSSQQQQQQPQQHQKKESKRSQIADQLHDASRNTTTQERQRDREYQKTLIRQEKGNADVDYSSWESGNAPDAMSLRIARSVIDLVRESFNNVTALRREMRHKSRDAGSMSSPLSEEAAGAVQNSLDSVYPRTTALVETLEEGLRSVMPLFSSSMRNTEGLTTLVQIREQLSLEAKRDISASSSSSSSTMVPKPPSSCSSQQQQQHRSHVSRLDSHPLYDRENESKDHSQPLSASSKSDSDNNNKILTTLHQVESQIQEQSEAWPADHRRHQAHAVIHQRVHPTKAAAAKRVAAKKASMMAEHGLDSIIPTALNRLLLASLPHSARSGAGEGAGVGGGGGGGDTRSHTSGGTASTSRRSQVSEMRRAYKAQVQAQEKEDHDVQKQRELEEEIMTEQQRQKRYGEGEEREQEQEEQAHWEAVMSGRDEHNKRSSVSPNAGAARRLAAKREHEELMARYPHTADGFSARILGLRDAKLGIWRQLSVTDKQHIVAFEQRENRYHHVHGVNNMKLAGLRLKLRRGRKMGIEVTASDAATMAEAEQRKRILEEQRHADVRQVALSLRSWLPKIPERFSDHPAPARQF